MLNIIVSKDSNLNESTTLNRLAKILVKRVLKIESDENLQHDKYKIIDVKIIALSKKSNSWHFQFRGKQKFNTHVFIGLSIDKKQVKHVWIVSNIKSKQTFSVSNTKRSLFNKLYYEVDAIPFDKEWQNILKEYNEKIRSNKNE